MRFHELLVIREKLLRIILGSDLEESGQRSVRENPTL